MINKIIVLVDNESVFLETLFRFLRKEGLKNIQSFLSAKKAYEFIRVNKDVIEVLFTDFSMPEMNGDLLVKQVKKLNFEIICIGMSAEEKEEIFREAGCYEFLKKPFFRKDIEDLLGKFKSL